jgi:hypothetical protein
MSQIETDGGENAIIFVQKLMSSSRGQIRRTNRAACVAHDCFALARKDGVRCRKFNTIWPCVRGKSTNMARKSVSAAAHIPPNTRPGSGPRPFVARVGLRQLQLGMDDLAVEFSPAHCGSDLLTGSSCARSPRMAGPGKTPTIEVHKSAPLRTRSRHGKVDPTLARDKRRSYLRG